LPRLLNSWSELQKQDWMSASCDKIELNLIINNSEQPNWPSQLMKRHHQVPANYIRKTTKLKIFSFSDWKICIAAKLQLKMRYL
jgi:hypothetical protein